MNRRMKLVLATVVILVALFGVSAVIGANNEAGRSLASRFGKLGRNGECIVREGLTEAEAECVVEGTASKFGTLSEAEEGQQASKFGTLGKNGECVVEGEGVPEAEAECVVEDEGV